MKQAFLGQQQQLVVYAELLFQVFPPHLPVTLYHDRFYTSLKLAYAFTNRDWSIKLYHLSYICQFLWPNSAKRNGCFLKGRHLVCLICLITKADSSGNFSLKAIKLSVFTCHIVYIKQGHYCCILKKCYKTVQQIQISFCSFCLGKYQLGTD